MRPRRPITGSRGTQDLVTRLSDIDYKYFSGYRKQYATNTDHRNKAREKTLT